MAALFALLGAEFIAGVQILVYVGGVMVLFLFVIMLVNVGAEEREQERLFNRPAQVGAAMVFAGLLVLGIIYAVNHSSGLFAPAAASRAAEAPLARAATGVARISEDTQNVGASLYRYGGLPFEIASVLLLVAIVGSVLLARTSKQEVAADDVDPQTLEASEGREP